MALACSGRGPLAVPPGLIRSACSYRARLRARLSGGPPRTEPQKSPRPTGTRVTRGTTLVDAASRRIHSWRWYRAPLRPQLLRSAPLEEWGEWFASAAQGRAQAACWTGFTATPGSLTNAAAVLVPVIAFNMEFSCWRVYGRSGPPVNSKGQNGQNGRSLTARPVWARLRRGIGARRWVVPHCRRLTGCKPILPGA